MGDIWIMDYSIDGNQVCAVEPGFRDLALDNAGFGDSLKEAFLDFYKEKGIRKPELIDCHPWEVEWIKEIG